MIKIKKRDGVVAELDGQYWGVQYADGQVTEYGFGPVENASISSPKYCTKPTDLAYPGAYYEDELKAATLRKITVTTTYEVN